MNMDDYTNKRVELHKKLVKAKEILDNTRKLLEENPGDYGLEIDEIQWFGIVSGIEQEIRFNEENIKKEKEFKMAKEKADLSQKMLIDSLDGKFKQSDYWRDIDG